jgi:hypothetical protein
MSEIYSEYYGTGRKASVTRLRRSLDPKFDVWEVTLYVGDKVIQRTSCHHEEEAENLAESFVQGGDGTQILLNEVINNG